MIVVVSFDSGDGEILVVDSRLVATDLNIEHESFIRTIDSNKTIIESSFGVLYSDSDNKGRTGRPEKFFWLTEQQSTFLMTLSRNTPEVILCKANLVKAFFEARDILQKQLNSSLNPYTLQRISLHHSNLEKPLPYGYFCCFDEMIDFLHKIDGRLGYKLGEQWYDRTDSKNRYLEPDISVGIHFSALFTRDYDKCYQEFNTRYSIRENNPKVRKIWDKKQVELKWKLDRAKVEVELRQKYFGDSMPLDESDIDRKDYKFQPSPESGRPDSLPPAYCYSKNYTSLFSDWLREVYFKFCWRDYILERDNDGWMKRYEKFKSFTLAEQKAFLTTAEGGMISGFEYRELWERQLPSGD